MILEQTKQLKQTNNQMSQFNETLENEIKGFHLKISKLNDSIAGITKSSQDK